MVDGSFKLISGALVEALRTGDAGAFYNEDIAYEEWLAVLTTGLSLFRRETVHILKGLAARHVDDGHRFNAVALLIEAGELDKTALEELLSAETDPDVVALLAEELSSVS